MSTENEYGTVKQYHTKIIFAIHALIINTTVNYPPMKNP